MNTTITHYISADGFSKWESAVMSRETLNAICGIFEKPLEKRLPKSRTAATAEWVFEHNVYTSTTGVLYPVKEWRFP